MSKTNPRFQVQTKGGCREVQDTWIMARAAHFHTEPDMPEGAQLLAETRASELNLVTMDPLGFVTKLSIWMDEAINAGHHPGNVIEDMDKIMSHWVGQVRGVVIEDLDQTKLYVQAPWVNRHGYGA